MRILWVKIGGLWPPDRGGRLRSFHTITELARRHQVTVLTTHSPAEAPDSADVLPGCAEVVSFPHRLPKQGSAAFAAALARSWMSRLPVDLWKTRVPRLASGVAQRLAAGEVDLCVADFLAAWPNVPRSAVPTVLFQHNVEHAIWRRLARTERGALRRLLLGMEWRKMRRAEARACAEADLTVAVSDADRALLAEQTGTATIRAVPTGVDTAYFAPSPLAEGPGRIVFCGSMDWYPNEDAVLHFVDDILPLIRCHMPEATLTVVGRSPSARLREAAARIGAEVTGTVDDVRPYMAEAAVCVVPLRVGGGTRLKILEALAMGKAVVSTTVGAEGLPLTPGQHYLQADEPAQFAASVLRLLREAPLRRRLGTAGRALVEARHSWAEVARRFEELLEEALALAAMARGGNGSRPELRMPGGTPIPHGAVDTGKEPS